MTQVTGLDHIAITVTDIEATCKFYHDLFLAEVVFEYAANGNVAMRQVSFGGRMRLSIHQLGNGIDLVARRPTVGSADICMRWDGRIESAVELLHRNGVQIIDGPSKRETADGRPSLSVYFRDPDGNLLELMADDSHPGS